MPKLVLDVPQLSSMRTFVPLLPLVLLSEHILCPAAHVRSTQGQTSLPCRIPARFTLGKWHACIQSVTMRNRNACFAANRAHGPLRHPQRPTDSTPWSALPSSASSVWGHSERNRMQTTPAPGRALMTPATKIYSSSEIFVKACAYAVFTRYLVLNRDKVAGVHRDLARSLRSADACCRDRAVPRRRGPLSTPADTELRAPHRRQRPCRHPEHLTAATPRPLRAGEQIRLFVRRAIRSPEAAVWAGRLESESMDPPLAPRCVRITVLGSGAGDRGGAPRQERHGGRCGVLGGRRGGGTSRRPRHHRGRSPRCALMRGA